MCIRKLLTLTVCIILHLYHQHFSANAIVAEGSMTYVSTDKMMESFKMTMKVKEAQI